MTITRYFAHYIYTSDVMQFTQELTEQEYTNRMDVYSFDPVYKDGKEYYDSYCTVHIKIDTFVSAFTGVMVRLIAITGENENIEARRTRSL